MRYTLPGALLVGLLAWSAGQIAEDVGQQPSFTTRGGLPVVLTELAGPPADDVVACWPSAAALAVELPELGAVESRLGALPPCSGEVPPVLVIDEWPGGRFLWRRGERLELQRW